MDKTTHEVRLANWKSIIEQCQQRPEGQTAKQLSLIHIQMCIRDSVCTPCTPMLIFPKTKDC